MTSRPHRRVMIAGAGVMGSRDRLRAGPRAGFEIVLVDPGALGDNASGVAAGMLAPAFEAVLDAAAADHFDLLRAARDRWPPFAEALGPSDLGFHRAGALWVASPGDSTGLTAARRVALDALGVACEPLSPDQVKRLAPGLSADIGEGLFVSDDWRVSPLAALTRLRAAAAGLGATVVADRLVAFADGVAELAGGSRIAVDRLVVATGAGPAAFAAEQMVLTPIKGHILCFPDVAAADDRPTLRWSGGYAVPGARGLTVGATMEPGLSDADVDQAVVEALHRRALDLYPGLKGESVVARAGVRAGAPDNLPLVGLSRRPDVLLAVGARRNGWLLAPLAAELILAHLSDGDLRPWAARSWTPRRFARA